MACRAMICRVLSILFILIYSVQHRPSVRRKRGQSCGFVCLTKRPQAGIWPVNQAFLITSLILCFYCPEQQGISHTLPASAWEVIWYKLGLSPHSSSSRSSCDLETHILLLPLNLLFPSPDLSRNFATSDHIIPVNLLPHSPLTHISFLPFILPLSATLVFLLARFLSRFGCSPAGLVAPPSSRDRTSKEEQVTQAVFFLPSTTRFTPSHFTSLRHTLRYKRSHTASGLRRPRDDRRCLLGGCHRLIMPSCRKREKPRLI
ncbi:hypothetical protein V8C26DRAFT_379841 [Trichoderma gracile]